MVIHTQTIEVNCDILAKTSVLPSKTGKTTDFEMVSQYPLLTIPLNLCNWDGTMRKTNKSDLYHILKNLITHQETTEVIKGNNDS